MPQFINSSRNVNMDPPTHARPYTEQERRAKIQFLNVFLATIEVECAILAELEKKKPVEVPTRRKIRPRRWYIREWIREREQHGHYHILLQQCRLRDMEYFKYLVRMEPEMFDEILARIRPRIKKQDTNFKKAIEPGFKLAVTLRFLATGEAYKSLGTTFRCGMNTISLFVPEVCEAIIQEYLQEVVVLPTTEDQWKAVAEGFANKWNFHHAIGAIDGKHIAMECPARGGSLYYNYKGYHSIVLLALADSEGRFLYIDVGANGSASDGGIFQVTPLREALEKRLAGLPAPEPLPGDDHPVPYYILGDNAFPMKTWLQKPFPQRSLDPPSRNFNYRLSRARRIVENAFGMLAQRFRVFLTTINVKPKTVEKLVMVGCILHNMLRNKMPHIYQLPEIDEDAPSTWFLDPLDGLEPRRQQEGTAPGRDVRNYLKEYYYRPENRLRR